MIRRRLQLPSTLDIPALSNPKLAQKLFAFASPDAFSRHDACLLPVIPQISPTASVRDTADH
jgi:hypothetical protein